MENEIITLPQPLDEKVMEEQIIHEIKAGARLTHLAVRYNISADKINKLLYAQNLFYTDILEERKQQKCIDLYKGLNRLPSMQELKRAMPGETRLYLFMTFLRQYDASGGKQEPVENNWTVEHNMPYTKMQLMEDFRDIALRLDRIPSMGSYYANSHYSKHYVRQLFKTFAWLSIEACNHFQLRKLLLNKRKELHRHRLISYLQSKAALMGGTPKKKDMLTDKQHPYMQYYRAFGSYLGAVTEAGLVKANNNQITLPIENKLFE